jgi:hypothetical protein
MPIWNAIAALHGSPDSFVMVLMIMMIMMGLK